MSSSSMESLTRTSSRSSIRSASDGGETWKYVSKQYWQPDRIPESDASMLNYKKQQRAKDPRVALQEQLEYQQRLKETIQALIRKPFKVQDGRMDAIEEEGAAGGQRADSAKLVTEKVAAKKKYVVAHFSHCYKVKNFHFPSEFAFVEFSVFNGLGKGIQGFVDTGEILEGFSYEARDQCKYLSNPLPPFDPEFDAERDALRLIREFLERHFEEHETAIIFAQKEYIPMVRDGLNWLVDAANCGYDSESDATSAGPRVKPLKFEVYPLSSLVVELMNESQTPEYRADISDSEKYHVDHECLIDDDLRFTKFSYYSDLACEHHMKPENMEGVPRCCETLVKSYVFNAFGLVKPFFKVVEKPNSHYPDLKLMARQIKNKRFNESSITAGPNIEGAITRFTSSERITDFITNLSGSDISASRTSLERQSSTGSFTDVRGSQHSSDSGSVAGDVVDSRKKWQPRPAALLTMPINKSVKKDKFKVDPEARYAYNLEDYLNQANKDGEVDHRPSYEEAVVNKILKSTVYTSEPSGSSQSSDVAQNVRQNPVTDRYVRGNQRMKPMGRGRRVPKQNFDDNSHLLGHLDDINAPAFEDLASPVEDQEALQSLHDDMTCVDSRSHMSLCTNSTLTGSQQSGFFQTYAEEDDEDEHDEDDYPDSASVVNVRTLKI